MKGAFAALTLFLIPALACASSSDPAQAVNAICSVLENIFYLLTFTVLGLGGVLFVLAAIIAIVLLVLTEDKKNYGKYRTPLIASVAAIPLLALAAIATLYILSIIFEGGNC